MIFQFLLLYHLPEVLPKTSNHSSRFLQQCPKHEKDKACDPQNIDKFVEYHLNRGDNLSIILSKTHMYGTCYHKSRKYCPATLIHCDSDQNFGRKWSLRGNCKKRGEPCPDLIIKDDCQNITCPENEYFCYPEGCISTTLQCHQKCHNFGSLNQVPCGKECISKFEGYK